MAVKAMTTDPRADFGPLADQFHQAVQPDALAGLAGSLGLSEMSLQGLRIGWSKQNRAWSFPMTDAAGNVLGIRLRLPGGRKLSVRRRRAVRPDRLRHVRPAADL